MGNNILEYRASRKASSRGETQFSSKFRSSVALAAIGAFGFGFLEQTDVALAGGPDACVIAGNVATCQGDQSDGITNQGMSADFQTPPIDTLNVNNLIKAIDPANGIDGVEFVNATPDGVTINIDTGRFGIETAGNNAEGIFVTDSGDGDISITSTGNISTQGANGEAIFANDTANGDISVITTGEITTTGANAGGIVTTRGGGTGAITINNNGNITTTGIGNGSDAIRAQNASVDGISITSTGDLSTQGDGSQGIFAFDNNTGGVMVTSTGNIMTVGDDSQAIVARDLGSGDMSVQSTGNITTSGLDATGISARVDGDGDVSVTSTGDIMINGPTSGQFLFSRGISAVARGIGDVSIVSEGDISTTSDFSDAIAGIQANGEGDVSISSTGDISTMGNDAEGIFALQNGGAGDVMVNSTSNIETAGENAEGIRADQESGDGNVTVISNGNITTDDDFAEGIRADQDGGDGDVTITSTGNITTDGEGSEGIRAQQDGGDGNVMVTSNGDIETRGFDSRGIETLQEGGDGDVTVTSIGDIMTDGDDAEGIFGSINVGGDGDINITSNGNIMATSAAGILADLDGNGAININTSGMVSGTTGIIVDERTGVAGNLAPATITNAATVTGTDGIAINFQGNGNDTLNILPGSVLMGDVDFGNGNDPVNGPQNPNDIDTLTAAPGVNGIIATFADSSGMDNALQSAPEITGGNIAVFADANNGGAITASAVDPSGFAASATFLDTLTGQIFNSIDNSGSGPDVAASSHGGTGTEAFGNEGRVWISGFAGFQDVEASDNNTEIEHDFGGITAGIENGFGDGTLGFFGGFANSDLELDFNAGDVDIDSYFGGVYWKKDYGTHRLNLAFVAGTADHESRRNTAGGIAEGDYDGWFISPSATFAAPATLFDVPTIASVRVSYAGLFLDDYTETGIANPLTVSDRDIHLFNTRAQLTLPKITLNEDGSHSHVEWRGGLEAQFDAGSDDVSGAISGAPVNFSTVLEDDVAAFAGLSITRTNAEESFAFTFSGEVQSTFDGGTQAVGEMKASFKF